MANSSQLIKKTSSQYSKVYPKNFTDSIKDRETGELLSDILSGFNMYLMEFLGTKELTRLSVPMTVRRRGLWISYIEDNIVYTEWYDADNLNDSSWKDGNNWREGNNRLVGDITISSEGNWIIEGVDTGMRAVGRTGTTPLIRVNEGRVEVSYNEGETYHVISDVLIANFKWVASEGSSQNEYVGSIQISKDGGTTWEYLTPNFTNNLHIRGYYNEYSELPNDANIGYIYGVGPVYDATDTEGTNPIYTLYAKDSSGWVNLGRFTSIAAGIVQSTGTSETEVMSQKAVTDAIYDLKLKQVNLSDITTGINPNILNIWDKVPYLEIELLPIEGIVNEYMMQFICDSDEFTLTFDTPVRWVEEPYFIKGNIYQISIINGLALYAEWED